MDAGEVLRSIGSFLLQVLLGLPRGEPLSIILAALVGLTVARIFLPRWGWILAKNGTILAFLVWFVVLLTDLVGDKWGREPLLVARGAGGALVAVALFFATKHAVRDWREGTPRGPHQHHASSKKHGHTSMFAHTAAWTSGGQAGWRRGGSLDDFEPRSAARAKKRDLRRHVNVFDQAKEQGLGTVIIFALFAEFAVVSTGIIAPPRAEVGMVFFPLLLLGCVIYLYHAYHRAWKTIVYFAVTCAVSIVASILFGHFWWNEPLAALLGPGYFASNSFVAATTGISFSLILYSKAR